MGTYIKYTCDECDFEYESNLEVFWIEEDLKLHVSPLTMLSSELMLKSLVSGYYREYYCYDCDKVTEEFLISDIRADLSREAIIEIIEAYNDELKIIKFEDKFQNCLECSGPLESKSEKVFSHGNDDVFSISDEDPREYILLENNENDKFWGTYHGYFCDECDKQINKFIIKENKANLDEESVRNILKQHTNDLTVLLFDDKTLCPNCSSELKFFDESSVCPNCKKGHLTIVEMADVN